MVTFCMYAIEITYDLFLADILPVSIKGGVFQELQ